MSAATLDTVSTAAFAPALLAYSDETSSRMTRSVFRMPGLRLELSTDSDGYLRLCERALIDSEIYSGGRERTMKVAVLDYRRHPDMPSLRVPSGDEAPLERAEVLGALGFDGDYDTQHRSWQVFDDKSLVGVEALQEAGHFPPWIASFPLRNFLHWGYQAIGWRMVHAGSLGRNGKGVMLAGASGAGKSGTVLAGVLGGLDSVGDDYLALDLSGDGVRAYPVTSLMKQDLKGLTRLGVDPEATGAGEPNWAGKYEFDFEVLGGGRRVSELDLQAMLIPRIAHAARTRITKATTHTAMLTFAPSCLLQLPGRWREGMSFTADVVRRMPAYHVDLSDDPREIAETIGNFVEKGQP